MNSKILITVIFLIIAITILGIIGDNDISSIKSWAAIKKIEIYEPERVFFNTGPFFWHDSNNDRIYKTRTLETKTTLYFKFNIFGMEARTENGQVLK